MDIYVGIDLAFAKRKRLPIYFCSWCDRRLIPIKLSREIYPPRRGVMEIEHRLMSVL